MDSSDTYEGKKENCTVMCYEFIKDKVIRDRRTDL